MAFSVDSKMRQNHSIVVRLDRNTSPFLIIQSYVGCVCYTYEEYRHKRRQQRCLSFSPCEQPAIQYTSYGIALKRLAIVLAESGSLEYRLAIS